MGNSQTAVITGASSFVGHHLIEYFAKNNWRVIAGHSRNLSEYGEIQRNRFEKIKELAEFECIDICNQNNLFKVVDKYSPKLWIQHAGYTDNYTGHGYDFSKGLEINAASVPKLFNAISNGKCNLIFTGTEAEYGTKDTPHLETDTAPPKTPYGLTKLAGTLAARQYADLTGVSTRVARLFIPFGQNDNPNKLFSQVVLALKSGKAIELTECTQKRDFLGIMDVCSAYYKMADDLHSNGFDILNICSGSAITLSDFIIMIAHKLGADISLLKFGSRRTGRKEANIIVGNNRKE